MPNATNTTTSLPVDILRLALPYMTLKSRLQLADTCRYWRGFLLNEWEDMWDTIVITVTRDNKDNISNADLNRVLLHAPRDKIRHLSFRSSDNNSNYTIDNDTTLGYKDIGSSIVKHGYRQIETMVYDVQQRDVIEDWFGELVTMNKETLKHLWLRGNLSASNAKAWLSTVLITCSELQELCCMATHLPSSPPSPGAPIEIGLLAQLPPRLPLTRLALSTIELTSALPAIISHCPHLEELVFDESYSPTLSGGFDFLTNDILEQVDQNCPSIKHISINTTACMEDPFEYGDMSRAGPGLQVLKCTMIPPAGYSGTLQMLIDKHYTTLEKLILRIGKPDRIMDIQPIPPLVFPGSCQQLRYLTLHDSPHRMMQSYTSRQLCDLLRACPCLDSLSLKSHALYTTDVYAALADMTTTSTSTLRHLYLECPTSISVREKDDYQHVSQSISDLFETQGAARLKTIELHLGGLMNDRILEPVGNGCTSLSQLVIGRSNALTVAGMIAWAQHTQQTRLTHASFYLYDDQSVMNSSENLLLITMALSLLPQLIHLNLAHPTVTYKEAKEHLLRFCILSRSKWRPKITFSGFNPTTGPFTAQFRLQGKVENKSCDEWMEYSCQEWWDKSPKPMSITVHYDHQKHRVHMGNKY